MSDQNFNNDLFGDQYYEKKARKSPLLSKYSGHRTLPHIRIPVEYAVVLAIGVMVLMIISYAVGVEMGRRSMSVTEGKPGTESFTTAIKELEESTFAGVVETAGDAYEEAVPADEERVMPEEAPAETAGTTAEVPEEKAEAQGAAEGDSPYIVQLASFRNRYSAGEEAEKLKEKNIDARVSRTGDWYQVYASGYYTIDEARQARRELSEDYADCYIRKLR